MICLRSWGQNTKFKSPKEGFDSPRDRHQLLDTATIINHSATKKEQWAPCGRHRKVENVIYKKKAIEVVCANKEERLSDNL